MNELIVLYGTNKEGFELLISENRDENHIKKAEIWAKNNGFDNLRRVIYKDNYFETPNFVQTINK